VVLGALVFTIGVLCFLLIRNKPEDMGLQPVERKGAKKDQGQADLSVATQLTMKKGTLLHLGGIYFLFGFTVVIYVTFVVTTLITEYGFSEAVAGRFWVWFGLLGMLAGPIFGSLSDLFGRARTLVLVYALQGLSFLLLALNPFSGSIFFSIGIFALCAWSVPSIMAAAAGDYMGSLRAAAGFATLTLFFSMGQITGPAIAGMMAERSGSFSQAYLMAGLLMAIGALLSMFLPKAEE
jgi:predicted MFS family arabinose efflux permease